jgi:hypothetical protein
MRNVCSDCRKDARVLYPGNLCPGCYGEKVPGSNELKNAWKKFMEKSSRNKVVSR